jgi:hypothetical protein
MAKLTRKFTIAELEEIGVPFELDDDQEVSDRQVESRRWVALHELLFRHDGQVWAVRYEVGLTEEQECEPFGTSDPEAVVTATAMEERQVTVTKWLPINTEES